MSNTSEKKLNGTVIVTYRCNARCSMCNRYKAPSKPEEEISIETIKKLPKMYFTNITGGEPFIRTDLKDIVRELYKKFDRIVISTNGFGVSFNKADVAPTSFVEFEGETFRAPANPDQYLKNIYGDYMKLPPEDKRKGHAAFFASRLIK